MRKGRSNSILLFPILCIIIIFQKCWLILKKYFHDGITKYIIGSKSGVYLDFQQGNWNVVFDQIHVRDTEVCFVYFLFGSD